MKNEKFYGNCSPQYRLVAGATIHTESGKIITRNTNLSNFSQLSSLFGKNKNMEKYTKIRLFFLILVQKNIKLRQIGNGQKNYYF